MRAEIEEHYIKIKGNNVGDDRHLKIYCSDMDGDDYFSISVIKDGMEIGCGGSFYMNKNNIIRISEGGKKVI